MATGVSVSDNALSTIHEVAAHQVSFVVLQIHDGKVEVDVAGPAAGGDFQDTLAALTAHLPSNEPRFAVASGPGQELVYIRWAPDSSPVKAKMLYAGSGASLKAKLSGHIVVEVQATEKEELSYQVVAAAIQRFH
mmetsp:Transcript_10450/g.22428  ORF Transcript_10450/g.22428 Transcript_10450/m.22428 type:complete len:135 (+) Transcript_10450:201-605(+)|eukprot:CAMPEP_0202889480 /NCGR_PEP_ID=MMETSP1392-20130828/24_1 /ASSEMBLY_ACC=CAM_ASM_000868 /TAXON_ID=225041 /ORGANISM="Chlamydomonas chlamydogama, Strain SAG 11-48b" /LENGTH=134 /DNA_ID=CAMNT_0049572809 /DNA_START=177 /DNA_END=581 /DNA_ORIENTATION=+